VGCGLSVLRRVENGGGLELDLGAGNVGGSPGGSAGGGSESGGGGARSGGGSSGGGIGGRDRGGGSRGQRKTRGSVVRACWGGMGSVIRCWGGWMRGI
jgi:hypothetical protein